MFPIQTFHAAFWIPLPRPTNVYMTTKTGNGGWSEMMAKVSKWQAGPMMATPRRPRRWWMELLSRAEMVYPTNGDRKTSEMTV